MADACHPSDPWVASHLSGSTIALMKQYFSDLDSGTAEGAKSWVQSFAKTGVLVQSGRAAEGHTALYEERLFMSKNWPELKHVVKCIYIYPGEENHRFVVVGTYYIKHPAGDPTIQRNTAGEFHLVEENGALKIQRMEIYTDPSPLLELIK